MHSIESEQIILGTILLSPETSSLLVEELLLDDFSNSHHRIIFEAIKTAVAEGYNPSPVILAPKLKDVYIREMGINCSQYLAQLVPLGTILSDAIGIAQQLKDFSGRRAMVAMAQQLNEAAQNPMASISDAGIDAIKNIDEICTRVQKKRKSMFEASHVAENIIKSIQNNDKKEIITTGLLDLDKFLGGFHRGELLFAAGRPSMGKSALIFSMARQSAKAGINWLIFSLEMKKEAVVNRMLSDMVWSKNTPVTYERIAKGDLTDHEIYRLGEAIKRLDQASIMIDEQAGLSAAEIAIRSRRYAESLAKQGKRLDVIAIDHLGKVRASDRYSGNKVHETGEKSNAFAILSRELDVALVVAHQLNRANEKRENKRPELSDMRDSGDIEQDADAIIFPFRLAYYLERIKEDDPEKEKQRLQELQNNINMLEVSIGKNRNGRCKTIELFCDMGSNVIRDLA